MSPMSIYERCTIAQWKDAAGCSSQGLPCIDTSTFSMVYRQNVIEYPHRETTNKMAYLDMRTREGNVSKLITSSYCILLL